jgi:hypothetical protein
MYMYTHTHTHTHTHMRTDLRELAGSLHHTLRYNQHCVWVWVGVVIVLITTEILTIL